MRVLFVLLCSAAVAVAAPVPKVKAKRFTLDGTWEATSMTSSGRDILPEHPNVWVIAGDTLVRNHREGNGTLRPHDSSVEMKVNPDRPGEMDLVFTAGGRTGLFRTVFEVTADELTILLPHQDDPRPKELKEGAGIYLYKFKRVSVK